MKPERITVLILLLSFCLIGNLFSQKIFISPAGNDANKGDLLNPLATLGAACNIASGITDKPVEIIIQEGEYTMLQPLVLTTAHSRSDKAPLIIRGEEGKKVTFRGGIQITGWENVEQRLWRAYIPQVALYNSYFEQLYINGRRGTRARTPNNGFRNVRGVTETILEKGTGRAPELAVQKIDLDPVDSLVLKSFTRNDYDDALIVFYHNWDNTRKRITGKSIGGVSVYTTGQGMKPWNPVNKKSRYIIENYRAGLDAPGEWYLDRSGYLYYIPLEGETINNTVFYAPVIKEFISIRGDEKTGARVSNISFMDISFEVAAYHTPPGGNEPAQAAAPVDAVITLDFAEKISFKNCGVAHTGTYGIWFRRACNDCSAEHCYLHDLGAGGIKIGETTLRPSVNELTNNITVDNNIITDAGHVFPCAVGVIIFHASDNRITHNEISNLRYSGVSVGWVWGYAHSPSKRNLIAYNHIHHLGWGELCDMGGVYTLGASEGTKVVNNHIHHVYSYDYGGWGLYTDEGSYGIIMENNLVYKCKNSGFHQHYGKENVIRNNIFAFNIRSQLQATRVEEHTSLSFTNNIIYFDRGTLSSSNWHKFNLLTDYNCYWDTRTASLSFGDISFNDWQKSGKDVHSVIADPGFIDPESFNFNFRNSKVYKRMKFVPFDYTEAGVYGSPEWKQKSEMNKNLAGMFDKIIDKRESAN